MVKDEKSAKADLKDFKKKLQELEISKKGEDESGDENAAAVAR